MAFSFGGSKQRQSSSGQSTSVDASRSGGISGSSSVGGSESTQSIAFEDIFARLFGGAEGAAGGLDPSMLTDASNQLFSGGLDFLDSLGGGADSDFLSARMSGESPVLGEQITGLGEDLGQFFNEQILPGISSEAIAGGGLGGGRQGVAQGMAADSISRDFARGVTDLRSADVAARDAAASTLGNQRIAGAQAGIAGLGSLAGIADFGFGAELAPFDRLAAILGGPTVTGESSSFTSAEDFARNFSESFGSSQATNQSKGKSTSAKIGF